MYISPNINTKLNIYDKLKITFEFLKHGDQRMLVYINLWIYINTIYIRISIRLNVGKTHNITFFMLFQVPLEMKCAIKFSELGFTLQRLNFYKVTQLQAFSYANKKKNIFNLSGKCFLHLRLGSFLECMKMTCKLVDYHCSTVMRLREDLVCR